MSCLHFRYSATTDENRQKNGNLGKMALDPLPMCFSLLMIMVITHGVLALGGHFLIKACA